MKLPDITIHIRPVDVDRVAVSAEWVSPDGTPRTLKPKQSHNFMVLDHYLGNLVHELFNEIISIEERLNG